VAWDVASAFNNFVNRISLLRHARAQPPSARSSARTELFVTLIFVFFPQILGLLYFIFRKTHCWCAIRSTLHALVGAGEVYTVSIALLAPLAYHVAFRGEVPDRGVFVFSLLGVLVVSTAALSLQSLGIDRSFWVFHAGSAVVLAWTILIVYAMSVFTRPPGDETVPARMVSDEAEQFSDDYNEEQE
jgi:hypothetical protein